MTPPHTVLGSHSPVTRSLPTSSPGSLSSLTKKVSVEPPPSRRHRWSARQEGRRRRRRSVLMTLSQLTGWEVDHLDHRPCQSCVSEYQSITSSRPGLSLSGRCITLVEEYRENKKSGSS